MLALRIFCLVAVLLFAHQYNAWATGDCDDNGTVTIAEVQTAINMFLGEIVPIRCVDEDLSGSVSISEVQRTINTFLGLTPAGSVYSISGHVSSGSAGMSDVIMTLGGAGSATVNTDGNGNYSFTGLANGSYVITPAKTGFVFSPTSSPQNINGGNLTAVNFSGSATQSAHIVACPTSGTTNISIQNFSFTPSPVTVGVNGIVKWTNNDPFTHTVTSGSAPVNDQIFNSGNLGAGAEVCVQFLAAGSYAYFCAIHPSMTGSVTVQ